MASALGTGPDCYTQTTDRSGSVRVTGPARSQTGPAQSRTAFRLPSRLTFRTAKNTPFLKIEKKSALTLIYNIGLYA